MSQVLTRGRNFLNGIGDFFLFVVDVFAAVRRRPFRWAETLQQGWAIASVVIIPTALVSIPLGAVVALQIGSLTQQLGAQSFAGATSVVAIVREGAPIATALLLAGAAGSAICADFGSRTIREEIDALKVLGVDVNASLVLPRVVASMAVGFLVTGFVMGVGIAGGYFFNVVLQGGTSGVYIDSFKTLAMLSDVWSALFKGVVFGAIAALIGAYKGLGAKGGPKGVGQAVNEAVVLSFLMLFTVNYVLSTAYLKLFRRRLLMSIYPAATLEGLGHQLRFYGRSMQSAPRTLARYRRETLAVLSDITFGSGALAIVGGTVGVMFALSYAIGSEVGLQSKVSLDQIGAANFTAFLSAYFNTREAAPLIAGVAMAATIGCGFTAQLGAMRINEEVDALEVMGIPSVPFLVTTRMLAAILAVVPLYAIGLFSSYYATRFVTTGIFNQSVGTYDHYFTQYLAPVDVLWSFGKVIVFAAAIILIHCYYGFYATGGPAGVGVAVGRAIRTSIVVLVTADFFISFAIWGSTTTVRITG